MMFNIVKSTQTYGKPDAEDLYERLGIGRDATQAQIRKAYRKAAMHWHPDRHANSPEANERFKAIKEAYETLSNLKEKEFYDATGSTRPSEEMLRATATDIAMQAFAAHIQAGPTAHDMDLETFECVDIVANVVRQLGAAVEGLRVSASQHQKALSKLESMLRRFRKKKGSFEDSPVSVMIKAKIDDTKRAKAQDELNAQAHEYAKEVAAEYSYEADVPKPRPFTGFRFGGLDPASLGVIDPRAFDPRNGHR
jgi:curved DNA-binding protein CbpA